MGLSEFHVGDYVVFARLKYQRRHHKLVSSWIGQRHAVNNYRDHLFIVETIVSEDTRTMHLERV